VQHRQNGVLVWKLNHIMKTLNEMKPYSYHVGGFFYSSFAFIFIFGIFFIKHKFRRGKSMNEHTQSGVY